VSLIEEGEVGRRGKHYFEVAKEMLTATPTDFTVTPQQLSYIHFPIKGVFSLLSLSFSLCSILCPHY
jgi:hypothetical protein